jgi:hypothetical protein
MPNDLIDCHEGWDVALDTFPMYSLKNAEFETELCVCSRSESVCCVWIDKEWWETYAFAQ